MDLSTLSDEEVLTRLNALNAACCNVLANLIVVLGEVEERRLHLKAACPSMFDFCVKRLGMSEGATFRRLVATRLVRRFPRTLPRIASGEVNLSALGLVRDIVTEANLDQVLDAVAGKTKREVQEVVARYAPKPDVPATIRKFAAPRASDEPLLATALPKAPEESAPPASSARASVAPLSVSDGAGVRYKVQLTASAEFRDKLELATALMRHRNPSGDMAAVLEQALDALLVKLEKERLAATTRPKRPRKPKLTAKTPKKNSAAAVSRSTRREVFARDTAQCTYVDTEGRRCASRSFLELDHIEPRARGGTDDAENLRVRCRAHNRLAAEEVFGKDYVQERIHSRHRLGVCRGDDAHARNQASARPARRRSRHVRLP